MRIFNFYKTSTYLDLENALATTNTFPSLISWKVTYPNPLHKLYSENFFKKWDRYHQKCAWYGVHNFFTPKVAYSNPLRKKIELLFKIPLIIRIWRTRDIFWCLVPWPSYYGLEENQHRIAQTGLFPWGHFNAGVYYFRFVVAKKINII